MGGNPYPYQSDMADENYPNQNANRKLSDEELGEKVEVNVPTGFGCSPDPVGDHEKWQANADAEINAVACEDSTVLSTGTIGLDVVSTAEQHTGSSQKIIPEELAINDADDIASRVPVQSTSAEVKFELPPALKSAEEKKKLVKMGFATAVAIGT